MDTYYFIEKNGAKEGPLKLIELKQLPIYADNLIWRSDGSEWKKATEYDEIQDIIIIKPPPTPKEQRLNNLNATFRKKYIGKIILIYLLTAGLIGIISYSIAFSSWDTYLNTVKSETVNNSNGNSTETIPINNSDSIINNNNNYDSLTTDNSNMRMPE